MRYSIFVKIGTEWQCAKDAVMSKSAAHGSANQFAQQYDVRVFRGTGVGRLVLELSKGQTTGQRGIL